MFGPALLVAPVTEQGKTSRPVYLPAGADWRKIDTCPGVPETTYVADLEASLHDADTVFAAFNNHKSGDF